MRKLLMGWILGFSLTCASLTAARPTRNPNEILPPDQRLCGLLAISADSQGESIYWLDTKVGRLLVEGPEPVERGFDRVVNDLPFPVSICMPWDQVIPPPESPLWVPWFFYTDPRASGVSVVNQSQAGGDN